MAETEIPQMQDGVMYANYSYDGSPISVERLDHISRHGGATAEEARCMAADLWQRRMGDELMLNIASSIRSGAQHE